MKRQVMESSIISSSGPSQAAGLQAPSPVVSHSGSASLAALYGYPGLLPQAPLQTATPTYYQQGDFQFFFINFCEAAAHKRNLHNT